MVGDREVEAQPGGDHQARHPDRRIGSGPEQAGPKAGRRCGRSRRPLRVGHRAGILKVARHRVHSSHMLGRTSGSRPLRRGQVRSCPTLRDIVVLPCRRWASGNNLTGESVISAGQRAGGVHRKRLPVALHRATAAARAGRHRHRGDERRHPRARGARHGSRHPGTAAAQRCRCRWLQRPAADGRARVGGRPGDRGRPRAPRRGRPAAPRGHGPHLHAARPRGPPQRASQRTSSRPPPSEPTWVRQVAATASRRRGLVPARQQGVDVTDPIGGPPSRFAQMAAEVDAALVPVVRALRRAPEAPHSDARPARAEPRAQGCSTRLRSRRVASSSGAS